MEVSALTHPSSAAGLHGPSPLLRLQSDERLIALTRRGQHAAFETLCARYQSRLLSFCRHMLASREDAEDVLQEVFAAAFNAVLADEREINVRPWLYRIARNRSLNHLRRATAIGVDSMDTHFADHGLSTGERVMRRESFRELIGDVHELPETQRTALLLREIDALSYEQIAQAMETTVPSVKSLLVRARISLAEASEARKLSCDEVRLELGEAAEGLAKLSTPARRHVRGCERCAFFKKQLKANNHALAAILPVGPLLIFKKLLLTKLGSTASAGGAHVAGAGTVGAGATVAGSAVAGAGASGGATVAGGLLTAGAGAIATKAVAGLAAAAIVTAGAVAANTGASHRRHHAAGSSYAAVAAPRHASGEPVVLRERPQPLSRGGNPALHTPSAAALAARRAAKLKAAKKATTVPSTPAAVAPPAASPTLAAATPTKPTVAPPSATQVTEITTESTQLPASATSGPQAPSAPPSTSTTPTPAPTPVPAPPTPAPTPTVPAPTSPLPSPAGEVPSSGDGTEATGAVHSEPSPPAAPIAPQAASAGGSGASVALAEGEAPQRPLQNARRADFRRRRGL
jgi:RNA polymerase sigma factor (sigma-70 family)